MNDKQNTKFDDRSLRIALLYEMEKHFDSSDIEYFKQLLHHEDNVIRTRAVCILAEIGGKGVVDAISDTLTNDKDSLVRHEAAFALGQMGSLEALTTLSHSINSDPQLVCQARICYRSGRHRVREREGSAPAGIV